MKIEPGKLYKTRDERKAIIYAVYEKQFEPIHGAIYFDNEWNSSTWEQDGSFVCYSNSHEADLISEWEEPKLRMQVWRDEDGFLRVSENNILNYRGSPPKLTRCAWLDEKVGEE